MGHDVEGLNTVEAVDQPRMLLASPETDDENGMPASDESGSDDEPALGLQSVQLDDTERAILERLSSGACKRGKFISGDSHVATQPFFGLDGLFESFHHEQEALAMQGQVSGGRVNARKAPSRLPEKEAVSSDGPLFNSCFKVLFEMTDGAYREKCPDLMDFLTEELTQVHKRYKVLVKVGRDAGYGSPEFQKTLERIRSPLPEEPEPTAARKYKKRKYADPPLVDVYRQACERLTVELLDGAVRTQQLLLEDFQQAQRRQQALLRVELAAALQSPPQKVERGTCNDGLSERTLTVGGDSMGRESPNLMPQSVPHCVPISSARSPFTPNQWVEFEHQALIFKYMVAGVRLVNIPDEVMGPIRKSIPSTNGTISHPSPNLGAGALHLGVVSNANPEPGRCRRTDGKKWRCARDIVPDKKYCERHMHRGRHRSRPPASSSQLQLQASQ